MCDPRELHLKLGDPRDETDPRDDTPAMTPATLRRISSEKSSIRRAYVRSYRVAPERLRWKFSISSSQSTSRHDDVTEHFVTAVVTLFQKGGIMTTRRDGVSKSFSSQLNRGEMDRAAR